MSFNDRKAQISNLLDAEVHELVNLSILSTVFSLKHVKKHHKGQLHITLKVDSARLG